MGVYSVKGDLPTVDVVPEVVELDVDVLGARVHLGNFGNFKRATIVLKDTAMDCLLGGHHVESLALELLD